MSGRLSDALTAIGARAYPRSRRTDARVVRDCAREAIAAEGPRALVRESVALVVAGLRARVGAAAVELVGAPWRAALGELTLPLATALLLVWTFAFVPRYDHWPLGEGWAMLLGGSLIAVLGAALRSRWLTAGGAAAVLVAAVAPYLGFGTREIEPFFTPSFFYGWNVDFGAASLLPTLLLVSGGLSLRRGGRPRAGLALGRLAGGIVPAVVAAVALIPSAEPKPTRIVSYMGPGREPLVTLGEPYFMPWLPPSRHLLTIIGIALALAVVVTWAQARARPERLLATGLVLASVAYPLAWVLTRTEVLDLPWWFLNPPYPQLSTAPPVLLALVLMRRAGRRQRPSSG